MENKSKVDLIKFTFYILMAFGFIYFMCYSLMNKSALYENIVFGRAGSSFTDFWDCVRDNIGMTPYQLNSSYPAIANLIFAFISKFVPNRDAIMSGQESIITPLNQIIFLAFTIVLINIFIAFINFYKTGNAIEKVLFSTFILLSAPYIFMFERGNIIFLSLVMLLAFLCGKDSKNRWIREISYVCLGCSAALKIYPAVFGFLLLKDKKYKEAARTVLYGILLMVLPFFAYGGLSDMRLMFNNMSVANEVFNQSNGVSGRINMIPTITVILGLFGIDHISNSVSKVFLVLPYIYMIIAIIACIFHKSEWKVMTLLTTFIVLVPGFSYVYTLVFIIIPLISFLDSMEKRTWIDWVALFCFIAIIIPIPNDLPDILLKYQTSFRYVLSLLIQGSAVLILAILLTIEGLKNAYKELIFSFRNCRS